MNAELDHLRQLTATLRQNLELCALSPTRDPSVDAIHDVRTGTRRVEAMLDAILRTSALPAPTLEAPEIHPLHQAAKNWLRLLRKIRRAAAPVRDLDVHRKLLTKFTPSKESTPVPESSSPATLPARPLITPVAQQAEDLDAWLKHLRRDHAESLLKSAAKWAGKLDPNLAAFEAAIQSRPARRRVSGSAARSALEAFAQVAFQMQQLDAGNLHDFRKGAKKARYMAESGGADEHAGVVGKALKKLQDEIGDWHDWLVLAEEAHKGLAEHGTELIALIESRRDQQYASAMKISERMRGRLMGEWRALHLPRPRTSPSRTSPPRTSRSRTSRLPTPS